MSSAVRQVVVQIGAMQTEVDSTADTLHTGSAFPSPIIIAFIKGDPDSIRVAKKSGFRYVGIVKYHGNEKKDSEVWVADWKQVSGLLKK
ncbi:MAG: hypothetical protein UY33_C0046G0005 [Candidatus Amesbacteria bacterium GW2011_GWA1_48_9]|uniref:Uncharacterized protein n=3 Tax=Candidatus Amesiibacteriota TaxID=1752730 RepID=A0A0G1UF17_9BACT|nr:MAG: hypothetical protein UY22_C0028G0006 [Candidatus Amesbacteria bacterium GW2011_GWC1_48_10]KKU98700.1 MAG: hypothetical protein UY33_C0046G0005 [Candidatus Amesbacteria bacterium GW2011_GWA1_48_9]